MPRPAAKPVQEMIVLYGLKIRTSSEELLVAMSEVRMDMPSELITDSCWVLVDDVEVEDEGRRRTVS